MTNELTRVRQAARRVEQARDELRSTILAARAAGATLPQIAGEAGLTKQRVSQIVNETSAR
jgi:hypothetical protein